MADDGDAELGRQIREQVHFYFSERNLRKDKFLQKSMDEEGWVPLRLISSFNKMRALTSDPSVVQNACLVSTEVELNEDLSSIRRKGWKSTDLASSAPTISVTERMQKIHTMVTKFVADTSKPTWMTVKLLLRRVVRAVVP